jgi:hypothetical protein
MEKKFLDWLKCPSPIQMKNLLYFTLGSKPSFTHIVLQDSFLSFVFETFVFPFLLFRHLSPTQDAFVN